MVEDWDDFGKDVDSKLADTTAVDIGLFVVDRLADLIAMGEKWIHSKVRD